MASITISELTDSGALAGEEIVEISKLSPTVTITATTISALASDNSFNDSADGLIAAGFAVNDRVKVVGFTGNAVNNIYVGKITALTAGKMTIGGTDGDVIVDDAAGESVTITKWISRRTTMGELGALANTLSQKVLQLTCTDPVGAALSVGDGIGYLIIPALLNGMNLIDAQAALVGDASSSGVPTFQIANETAAVDMLSTKITIDVGEQTSYSAAVPSVVNAANDGVVTGDILRVDVDVAGTGAKGLIVILTFELP